MTNRFFRVSRLDRTLASGQKEHLDFGSGVNLLIGRPNTGKTKWLQTLDFLLGDDGQNPFEGSEETGLDQKYESAGAEINIAGESFRIDRWWRRTGAKGKVFVDGEEKKVKEFQHWLMEKLGIPILHYPKGNPMSGQTWPELSFRSLLRHIHRQQRFWGDLADRQYDGEQHACLLQFLGLAETLFSEDHEELIRLKMAVQKLTVGRDQYGETLEKLTREILSDPGLSVSVTEQSVKLALERVQKEIEELQLKRDSLLNEAKNDAFADSDQPRVSCLGAKRADLVIRIAAMEEELHETASRLEGLQRDRLDIESELERIARVGDAGEILSDLKVTNCPACDQPVVNQNRSPGECFLCHQAHPPADVSAQLGAVRIEYEQSRLKAESKEVEELITVLERDAGELSRSLSGVREELVKVEHELRPARKAISALVQDEVGAMDRALGEASEKQAQLNRVMRALEIESKMQEDIEEIEGQIEPIQTRVDEARSAIDFDSQVELLEAGINEYLNAINKLKPDVWNHGFVSIDVSASRFKVRVGRRKWDSVLGGTDSLYFLMAYNYGLLSLSDKQQCNYPGFAIIDVPGEFSGEEIGDKENFIVQPYIDMLSRAEYAGAQLIMTGASFSGLDNVARKRLDHVYAAK